MNFLAPPQASEGKRVQQNVGRRIFLGLAAEEMSAYSFIAYHPQEMLSNERYYFINLKEERVFIYELANSDFTT